MTEPPPDAGAWKAATPAQRAIAALYAASHLGFVVLVQLGGLAALAGVRAAGYVLVVGLSLVFLARDAAIGLAAVLDRAAAGPGAPGKPFTIRGYALSLVVVASIDAGVFGWRLGAYIAVCALAGRVLNDVAFGIAAHQRVMRRPWPEVAPFEDDDW